MKVLFRQIPRLLANRRISDIKKYVFSINLLFQDFPFLIVKSIFIYLNLKQLLWLFGGLEILEKSKEEMKLALIVFLATVFHKGMTGML